MAKLDMKHGDDRTLRIAVKDKANRPYPWPGVEIWFTAKKSLNAGDDAAVIKKSSLNNDFDLTVPGQAVAPINKEDTQGLPNKTETYFYDVQVRRADGKIETVDDGTITIRADVTHAT